MASLIIPQLHKKNQHIFFQTSSRCLLDTATYMPAHVVAPAPRRRLSRLQGAAVARILLMAAASSVVLLMLPYSTWPTDWGHALHRDVRRPIIYAPNSSNGMGGHQHQVGRQKDESSATHRLPHTSTLANPVVHSMPNPAIILFCYNRVQYLNATLHSLAALPGLNRFHVYISQVCCM